MPAGMAEEWLGDRQGAIAPAFLSERGPPCRGRLAAPSHPGSLQRQGHQGNEFYRIDESCGTISIDDWAPGRGRAPPRLTRLRREGHPALCWRPWPFERGDLLDSGGMGCRQSTSKDLRPETNALRKSMLTGSHPGRRPGSVGGKYRYR